MTTTAGFDLLSRFCTPRQREMAAKERRILDTAQRADLAHATMHTYPQQTPSGAIRLACYAWGEGDRVAILTHGWELQAGRMGAFVQPLVDAGFRVVAFDAPAHGQSEGAELNLPDYAAAIQTAAQHFGQPCAVIGHSFGGLAAAWYAAREPNRLDGFVDISAGGGGEFLASHYVRLSGLSASEARDFREAFRQRFGGSPAEYSVDRFGKDIRARTLVVHDRRDQMVGFEQGELYAASIPGAQLLATSGLGHRGILRDPDVVNAVVRFVAASG